MASLSVVILSSVVWLLRHHLNADVAWYLYAGMRLAEGAVLYSDVGDMNPPLIYWAQAPIVLAAHLTGLAPHVALILFVGLILPCGILWISNLLLAAAGAFSKLWSHVILLFTAFHYGIVNRQDVGQRDHIAAYVFLPFMLTAAARISGTLPSETLALGVSAMAGLAIALKPYFLLPWLTVLAYVAWRRGFSNTIRSPEFWMVSSINALYWLLVWLYFPHFFSISAGGIKYYPAINIPLRSIADALSPCAILIIFPFLRSSKFIAPLLMLGAATSLAFALEALVQHKGWSYHLVPAFFFMELALLFAIANFMQNPLAYRNAVHLKPHAVATALCCLMVFLALYRARQIHPIREIEALSPFLQQHANGRPVLLLTTEMWLAFPLVYEAQVRTSLAEPFLWTLPGLYYDQIKASADSASGDYVPASYHRETERNADEQALFTSIRRAVLETKPSVILVEDKNPKTFMGRLDFDYLSYLGTDPQLRAALSHYRTKLQDVRCRVLIRVD